MSNIRAQQLAMTKVLANDGVSNDRFGRTLSVYKQTVLIGATFDDNENGVDAGSAYCFEKVSSDNNWQQTAKVLASDGAVEDFFGFQVSISWRLLGRVCQGMGKP